MTTTGGDSRAPEGGAGFEVGALLDAAPLNAAHARVILLAALAVVMDGFDIQVLGFAAPKLVEDWGVTREALAPIFAAGIVGMAIGAIVLGPRGDAWGRRRALLASVGVFALATLGCALAQDTTQLLALRGLAGVGLGAALPNATAMMAETAPLRWRALLTSTMIVGVPIGGVLGGELAARLLPEYGWRSIFVVGGLMPLVLVAVLALWLPESARFLLRKGRAAEALEPVNRLQRARRFGTQDPIWLREADAPGSVSLARLFEPALRRDTIGLWTLFLASMFGVFSFMNWMPTVMVGLGHDLGAASRLLAVFNLGGVVFALLGAWLMRWQGSRQVLGGFAVLACLDVLCMAFADLGDPWIVLGLAAIAGGGINGLMVGSYVLSAHVYPTEVRTTGVGMALGVGRAGAVLSSLSGALVGSGAAGASQLFLLVGLTLVFSFVGAMTVRRHLPRMA